MLATGSSAGYIVLATGSGAGYIVLATGSGAGYIVQAQNVIQFAGTNIDYSKNRYKMQDIK